MHFPKSHKSCNKQDFCVHTAHKNLINRVRHVFFYPTSVNQRKYFQVAVREMLNNFYLIVSLKTIFEIIPCCQRHHLKYLGRRWSDDLLALQRKLMVQAQFETKFWGFNQLVISHLHRFLCLSGSKSAKSLGNYCLTKIKLCLINANLNRKYRLVSTSFFTFKEVSLTSIFHY